MAQPGGLCLLALLGLGFGVGGSPACYDPRGLPRRCMPVFENAAFGRAAWATNTCGSPPEDYCQQMGARHASQLCQRCDAADPRLHHNASLLTDFHSQEESTWWQSQSMAFGIQHPNSVNITLRLGRRGKRSLGRGMLSPRVLVVVVGGGGAPTARCWFGVGGGMLHTPAFWGASSSL